MPHHARIRRTALSLTIGALFATAAHAQQSPEGAEDIDRVVVKGEIVYRDRAEEPSTLVYDLAYFEQFEPLTVGDMLKRVPSAAFLGDVLEYDGVRLRGLDPGYTQILINGKRVPGAGLDRSFFVDRIPAELVERIEIVRSSSADRSGDAVAGSLNIVLRNGKALDGGYIRVGGLQYADDQVEPLFGAVWGGEALGGQLMLGVNTQGRRNPKEKYSWRYSAPGGTLDNTERQTDVRSGDDYSFTADYNAQLGEGWLNLNAFYVRTDRYQDENSLEYRYGIENEANLMSVNDNDLDIRTDNFSFGAEYEWPMAGGDSRISLGVAGIDDEQYEFEDEYEYLRDAIAYPEDDRFTGDRTYTDIRDRETSLELRHQRESGGVKWRFGVELTRKERDTEILYDRNRITIPNAPNPRPVIPGDFVFAPIAGGLNSMTETRVEPFVRADGKAGAMEWEAGLRYQRTGFDIDDRTVDPAIGRRDESYGVFLPSLHLRWNLDNDQRITASVARTMRRASFNQLSPALLEAELGDNDFLGNPALDPEKAWGLDLGWERRLGKRGVVGLNLFYRDVSDLIEVVNTGVEGSEGPGTYVLQAVNAGDGQVWGAEFDLSTPLTAFGLEHTGVFLNYSWLDSEITDGFGKRRFNDQADSVLNVGFIQDLPSLAASFGVTYRKQGDAYGRIVGEEISTRYGADLEAFLEKRIGTDWTLRLTGSNLLNAFKDETFDKFLTIADQIDRSYDEYELETEKGGRVYQLVARYSF
ncbi:MAG: TonB-dependent receptor plug domain-containing protein [Arenimonas sp.]